MAKEEVRFPRPPMIADIFDQLDEDTKTTITDMYWDWMIEAIKTARRVDKKTGIPALISILKYHDDDINKIIEYSLKPEFRPLKEFIKNLLV